MTALIGLMIIGIVVISVLVLLAWIIMTVRSDHSTILTRPPGEPAKPCHDLPDRGLVMGGWIRGDPGQVILTGEAPRYAEAPRKEEPPGEGERRSSGPPPPWPLKRRRRR
jgi:hypothetical protein